MRLELTLGSRRVFAILGADRVGKWGRRRFEVWRVRSGQLDSFIPPDSATPKLTRREATERARLLACTLWADEALELVDLNDGRHEVLHRVAA